MAVSVVRAMLMITLHLFFDSLVIVEVFLDFLRDVTVYAEPMEQRAQSIKMLFELLNALPSRDRGRQSQDAAAVDEDFGEDVEDAVVDFSGRGSLSISDQPTSRFEYPQHFVRFFKALTGKTPTGWRAV